MAFISFSFKHYSHSDKILTGSFDRTARLWSAETGECFNTLWGHTAEVVTVQFNPQSLLVGTSSMDSTARLYHIATGGCHIIVLFLLRLPLLQVIWV
jgi:WD40 repeat protein